jgi:hypothetical protein
MIGKHIKNYINDADYRLNKILNNQTNEEDILLLLKDLSGIIEKITKLRNSLAKDLDEYIIKN